MSTSPGDAQDDLPQLVTSGKHVIRYRLERHLAQKPIAEWKPDVME